MDEDRDGANLDYARTMNTNAGSKTAWIVMRIEATNQRANALRLIPAEHFWLIKCEICGRYAYPASECATEADQFAHLFLIRSMRRG
jgi:hypothetical protein